jgi:hypothetical protein
VTRKQADQLQALQCQERSNSSDRISAKQWAGNEMNGRPWSVGFESLQCCLHERALRLLYRQQIDRSSSAAGTVYLRTTTPWRRVAR